MINFIKFLSMIKIFIFFQENVKTKVAVNRLLVATRKLTAVNCYPALVLHDRSMQMVRLE
jgi:hypothetical protein